MCKKFPILFEVKCNYYFHNFLLFFKGAFILKISLQNLLLENVYTNSKFLWKTILKVYNNLFISTSNKKNRRKPLTFISNLEYGNTPPYLWMRGFSCYRLQTEYLTFALYQMYLFLLLSFHNRSEKAYRTISSHLSLSLNFRLYRFRLKFIEIWKMTHTSVKEILRSKNN